MPAPSLSPRRYYNLPPLEGTQRRFVVGDIHGCLDTFRHSVEKVMQLRTDDQLILLGDYIDRGPANRATLDYVMQLTAQGYRVFPLLGNHEYNLLDALENYDRRYLRMYLKQMKALDLLDMTGSVPEKYLAFIFELPHYLITEDTLFVHGGFDFTSPDRFVPNQHLLERRHTTYLAEAAGHRRVIHGHQPTPAQEIEQAYAQKAPVLPLDAGCVYAYSRPKKAIANGHGYLAVLELTQWRLTLVPNREFLP